MGYSILLYFSVSVEILLAMKLMLLFHKKAGLLCFAAIKTRKQKDKMPLAEIIEFLSPLTLWGNV